VNDGLGRLATATGPWGPGGAQASGAFTYDSLGNMRKKTLGSRVVDIEYLTNNRINRARDSNDGSVWRDYVYDARGNVTDNDRLGFTYDAAEQPTAISGAASGVFVYDGNLKRVKQVLGGDTVYSVYSLSGAVLYRDNATTGVATDYLRLGGSTVARFKNGVVSYLHQDHLGSPVASTDAAGVVSWREDYTPYGEERQDPAANDNDESFTGHIKDDATGLTYMQARYYDPVIGRFLSNDPVGFSVDAPQMFNRYSYTFNDPVNMLDPDGNSPNRAGAVSHRLIRSNIARNNGLAGLANNMSNSQRYFHTSRYGWVDVRHFGSAASYVIGGTPGGIVKTLGYGVEVRQTIQEGLNPGGYRSGFSPEDLPSNAAGVSFGEFAKGYNGTIEEAFAVWASESGATDATSQEFLDAYGNLSATDSSANNGNNRGSSNASSQPTTTSSVGSSSNETNSSRGAVLKFSTCTASRLTSDC